MTWKWFRANVLNRVTLQAGIAARKNFALVSYDKDDEFGRIFELCDRLRASYAAYSAKGWPFARTFDVPPKPSRADDRREGFDGQVSRAAPVTNAVHA